MTPTKRCWLALLTLMYCVGLVTAQSTNPTIVNLSSINHTHMKPEQPEEQKSHHQNAAEMLWRLKKINQLNKLGGHVLKDSPAWQDLMKNFEALKKAYLAYKKATPADQLLPAQQPTSSGGVGGTTIVTPAEDIDCSTFSNAVVQWRTDITKFFRTHKKSHAQVVFDTKKFKEELALSKSTLPIVASLYEEWQTLLSGLEATITGEELFTALSNQKGTTWIITNELKAVENHYKANKKAYKKYEANMEVFQEKAMPKQQYFLEAIAASSAEDDPNLPDNKTKMEKGQEKWNEIYRIWLNTTLKDLEVIDTTEEGAVMDLDLLSKNRGGALDGPKYAEEFWQVVGFKALREIQGIGGEVSYLQAKELVEDALLETYNRYVTDDFLQSAIASGEDELPRGLKGWLKTSTNHREGLQGDFEQEYIAWTKEISKVIAICENQNKGKTFTVDLKKLTAELTERFSYTVNNVQPGKQLLKNLQEALPKTATTNFTTLLTHWKDGITALQNQAVLDLLWEEYLTKEAGGRPLTQVINAFISKLPSQESLINALLDSRYQAQKAAVPVPKDKLYAHFEVIEQHKNYAFAFPLPLTIKSKAMSNGTTLHYAIPNIEGLSLGDIINQGGNSYQLDSVNTIGVKETKLETTGNTLNAWTMVSFKLSVTDTTLTTTIEEAKEGSLDIVTLNLDQIVGLKKNTGIDLFNGDTVGIGLRLVGSKHGGLGEIQASGVVMGFKVTFHMGKKGWYVKTASPLDFKAAVKQATEGITNYDIFFSVEVYSKNNGTEHLVYARNGQKGDIDGTGSGQEFLKGRDHLVVKFAPTNIMVPLAK